MLPRVCGVLVGNLDPVREIVEDGMLMLRVGLDFLATQPD